MREQAELIEKNQKDRRITGFLVILAWLDIVCAAVNYDGIVRSYNTTMLALAYRNGFTSRSLLGELYHLLDALLPVNMISYHAALVFACIVTACFIAFLWCFARFLLRHTASSRQQDSELLIILLHVVLVSTFADGYNFLRVDLFMIAMSLSGVMVLTSRRAEWLVVPLSALGVMFHQGYVFMYFNLILVLLIYRFLSEERRRRYGILFLLSFGIGSALFLWFEFFSRTNGEAIFPEVEAEAKALSCHGIYHATLLYHEVLGIDLSASENFMKHGNHMHLLFFMIVSLPFEIELVRFFASLIRRALTKRDKLKYVVLAIGAGTMLPDFMLKVDYGRWVLAVITYYLVVILALVAFGDELAIEQIGKQMSRIRGQHLVPLFLLLAAMMVPFLDVDINAFVRHISEWIGAHL